MPQGVGVHILSWKRWPPGALNRGYQGLNPCIQLTRCPLHVQAVGVHGFSWKLVATLVPGREEVQCRERFLNVLDPAKTKGPWSQARPVMAWPYWPGHNQDAHSLTAAMRAQGEDHQLRRAMEVCNEAVSQAAQQAKPAAAAARGQGGASAAPAAPGVPRQSMSC